MSRMWPARRRAEKFQRLLEGGTPGGDPATPEDRELTGLATFAAGLAETGETGKTPGPAPRAEFSADLRARLMAAAATELAPDRAPTASTAGDDVADRLTVGRLADPAVRRRHQRRATTVLVSLAVVGGGAGTAMASQAALPGDPLYGVKQTIERVGTSFSSGDHERGSALLGRAEERLSELSELTGRPDPGADPVRSGLLSFSEQASDGADLLLEDYHDSGETGSVAQVREFTAASLEALTRLEPGVPDGAREALTDAADALLEIDRSAEEACPACGGRGITELPGVLVGHVSALPPPDLPTAEEDRAAEPGDSGTPGEQAQAGGKPAPELPSGVPSDVPGTVPDPQPTVPHTESPDAGPAAPGTGRPSSGQPVPSVPAPSPGDGPRTRILTGEDGVITGDEGLLPKDRTGPVGSLIDGAVGGVEDLVGGVLGGRTGRSSSPTPTP